MMKKNNTGIYITLFKTGGAVLTGLILLVSLGCRAGVQDPSLTTVPYETYTRDFKTFYLKQSLFTLGDHFKIVDERGIPRFMVKGRIFTLGDRLRFYDINGNELAFIKQKLISLKKRYRVFRNGRLWARIIKNITLFKDRFRIDVSGPDDYIIRGDLTDHLYAFIRRGKPVAFINKKWFSWGDSYKIDIDPGENEVLILIGAIVVDMASHDDDIRHSQT
jgi:uncharacterized protein YxjI